MPASKHINYYYGFWGLFVLLFSVISFFMLQEAACTPLIQNHYDKLKPIQIAGSVIGLLLFLLSFLRIANLLYDIKVIFFIVILTIISMSGVMFWGAYIAFSEPCIANLLGLDISPPRNAFVAEDGHNIAVMVLDIFGGLLLLSIGGTFARQFFYYFFPQN